MEYLYGTKVSPPHIIILDDHKRKKRTFPMERHSTHHLKPIKLRLVLILSTSHSMQHEI